MYFFFPNVMVLGKHAALTSSPTYSIEISEAIQSPLHRGTLHTTLIAWNSPPTGEIKLNTDRCWYKKENLALGDDRSMIYQT